SHSSLLCSPSSGVHAHLHSFPTRRSSDLPVVAHRWPDYRTPSGERPVRDFIMALVPTERAAIVAAMREVRTDGLRFARHLRGRVDRKSTRLNSSHLVISYAVFCLKKKKTT